MNINKENHLFFYVIMTPFPFYKNMLNFSGWSCSYKNGALLAKFQPGVLNPFVLICGCLLYQHGKRKCLHKKWVELPQDWFGTPTWQTKVFTLEKNWTSTGFAWYTNIAKESVYIREELNSHRIGLVHQHGKKSVNIREEFNSHRIGFVHLHGKKSVYIREE